VAAVSALAGAAPPHVHAAGADTIRLALIGAGPRGTGAVADAFAATGGPVTLYAVADIFADKIQGSLKNLSARFQDRIDVPPERQFVGFDAYRKAIDCLGPNDVAMLTTAAAFRPPHFEYAVQKGVNVFMEKSFAVDAPANRRLLAAAELSEKKNLKVASGFMWRHSAIRKEVVRRIRDGAIGDVHTLRIYRVHGPTFTGRRPANQTELEFQLRRSACFHWQRGGFLLDWHCHNVDQACWVKDAWPVSAQGMGGRCFVEAGNLFDHYAVELTFADGAKLFSFSRHMAGCWQEYADYVHGAKGSAVLMATLAEPKSRIYKSQSMVPENLVWQSEGADPNPYHAEWQLLLDAIRQDRPHNEARRSGLANMATLMGRMAAHTGQFVTWDEAMNSKFQYMADIDSLSFDTPAPIQPDADGVYPAPLPGICKEI
jgi:predicted dehydrogenase